jgi:hypothetical protein
LSSGADRATLLTVVSSVDRRRLAPNAIDFLVLLIVSSFFLPAMLVMISVSSPYSSHTCHHDLAHDSSLCGSRRFFPILLVFSFAICLFLFVAGFCNLLTIGDPGRDRTLFCSFFMMVLFLVCVARDHALKLC